MFGIPKLLVMTALMMGMAFSVVGVSEGLAAEDEMPQQPREFEARIMKTVRLDYLLYLPPEYKKTDEEMPLMLFLHGMGERGDELEKVKKHGPPKLIEKGKDFPFIVVSPQCPRWSWWPVEVETLDALLDKLCEEYRVDEDRIYVTGLSMGGYGTWALAEHQPDRFAAIAPICGGHRKPEELKKIAHLPVWVFHGGKDRTVPVERSKRIVEVLKDAGGDPKLTIYPEAGHDSWTKTYNNPELYDWLLKHSKEDREEKRK